MPANSKKSSRNKKIKKTRFANIELPLRDGDVEREGKKSVSWEEDPEILQRLVYVAELMNQNKPSPVIAEECGVSLGTAKRDIGRVRELWKLDAKERLGFKKEESLANYRDLARRIHEDLENLKPRQMHLKPALYTALIKTLHRIDQVSGIGDNINLGNQNGKPFEIKQIEEVRMKRWQTVASQLGKVVDGNEKPSPTIN